MSIAARKYACHGPVPFGIRSLGQVGLHGRLGCAGELACERESVPPVVLPRCIDVYFLNGVRAGISRVQF